MLVRMTMSLMKDKELYKRDWEMEGLVNFIGKNMSCAGYEVTPFLANRYRAEIPKKSGLPKLL